MSRRLAPELRRVALDWVVPLAILAIGIVNLAGHARTPAYPGPPAQHLAFLAVAVAALGLRRRAPVVAPCVAIAAVTWWALRWPVGAQGPFEGFLVLVGAAYSLGTVRDRRMLVLGGGVLVVWLVGGLFADLVGGRAGDLVPLAVWLTVAFGVGYLISRRTQQAHVATEAARVLAAEQDRQTARAVEEERARIARELHDVVAHGLSVIVVQAGAERRSLRGPGTETRPEAVAVAGPDVESIDAALGAIEKAGRDALADLRRLLGLLRRTEEPLALRPQPGLAQLDDLVASVREAGLDVELEVDGDPPQLPAGLDLTVYRIVQEALTNVLKHADARRVRVGIRFQRNVVDLRVSDDGGAAAGGTRHADAVAASGAGQGLIGMRERVRVFGGSLATGARESGGWEVHARLPIAAGGVR